MVRVVDLLTHLTDREVLLKSGDELFFGKAVQILYDTVVVQDLQLALREAHCHEEVVLLVSGVVRVLSPLLGSDTSGCCCTVVTVSNIESVNIVLEQPCDLVDGLVVIDHPELVAELVLVDEIVLRSLLDGLGHNLVQHVVVLVGEEHRLDVGVLDAYVNHSVILLVLAGELVLLDLAGSVVIRVGAENESVLCAAFHGLGIDVVALLRVAPEPTLLLPLLEILHGLVIDLRVVILKDGIEVDLRLGDVEEGFLSGHLLGLFGVKHVIRRGCHLCHNIFRRPDRRERFYSYHNILGKMLNEYSNVPGRISFRQPERLLE